MSVLEAVEEAGGGRGWMNEGGWKGSVHEMTESFAAKEQQL